jgi:hypothetical protein
MIARKSAAVDAKNTNHQMPLYFLVCSIFKSFGKNRAAAVNKKELMKEFAVIVTACNYFQPYLQQKGASKGFFNIFVAMCFNDTFYNY